MLRTTLFFNAIFLGLPLAIISGNVFTICCLLGAIVAYFLGLQFDQQEIIVEEESKKYLAVNIPCLSPEWVDITTVDFWIECYLETQAKIDNIIESNIDLYLVTNDTEKVLSSDDIVAKQSSYSIRI